MILYVLLAGFLPFEENTMIALFLKIKNADFTYPSWFSPELRKLLDKILVSNPMLRLTLAELKHHPWVADGPASKEHSPSTRRNSETKTHKNTTEAVEQSRREAAEVHARGPAQTRPQSLQITSSSGIAKNGTLLPALLANKSPDPKKTNGDTVASKQRHSVGSRNSPLTGNPVAPANSKGAETKSNEPTAPARHPAQIHSNGNDPTIASRRNSKNPQLRPPGTGSGPSSGTGSGTGPGSGPSSGPTPLSGGTNVAGNSVTGSKSGSGTKSGGEASKAETVSGVLDALPKQSCCVIA